MESQTRHETFEKLLLIGSGFIGGLIVAATIVYGLAKASALP